MSQNYPRVQWAMGEPIQAFLGFADNTSTAPGRSIQISCGTGGTVTLTTVDNSIVVVNPAVGDNIYPYAVIKAVAGTAVGCVFTNLL